MEGVGGEVAKMFVDITRWCFSVLNNPISIVDQVLRIGGTELM